MPSNFTKVAFNESTNGEEVISHLIETARTLKDADQDESLAFFEKALHLSKNANFNKGTAECLLELGKINYQKGIVRPALSQLQEAGILFDKSGEPVSACESAQVIADICFVIGNNEEALDAQLKALNFCKKIDNKDLQGKVYNKLGTIYKALGDYPKAIENHKNSLTLFEGSNNKAQVAETNYFIGNCYNWIDDIEQSFTYLDRSLTLADEINNPELQVKPTGSLAILFTKMKEFDKSMDYFFRAIDYVNITQDMLLKADLLKSLGNLYIETGQYEQAITILNESLEIAESLKIKFPKNLIHRFLSDAYEKLDDYKNSLLHHKNFTTISREIMNEEIALKTKGIELRYDLEETRKEKEQAMQTVQLKDAFIANISHEIRTPINGVLGMAALLADTKPTAEQLEYINTIKLSANNLIATINDILDYSKIHSGELRFDSNEFKIGELFTGVAQLLKVKADEKNIRLNFTYDQQIPDLLIGDSLRLNQILTNLIGNAVKFTEKGSVVVDMQMLEPKI
ncbi:MAG: tetratricopeptide repeat protein [Bacteroidetes bacterium]|nr:tetratricopeptide repeat protein [Bacteroidota bacterium]